MDFEDDQVGPDVDMGKLFMDKPSRVHYPDYYTLIARPIGLNDIKRKIQSSRYRNRYAATGLCRRTLPGAHPRVWALYGRVLTLQKGVRARLRDTVPKCV